MSTIRLYRHPDCLRCARLARRHRRLDWLGRFEDATESPLPRPLRKGEVLVRDLRTGELHAGADGVALLFRQIPAYWPLLPLLALPPVRRRVERDVAGDCGDACAVS
ncbi:MAG TPA: hypothetical protein VEY50_04845 [Lysobacter sp.]|nr:hypothetical protein [Lysobacter sp.]